MSLQHITPEQEFPTFTVEELEQAFTETDLDANGFIGANEVRAIFKYIQEDVTDLELDVMIKLVDKDGDSQIDQEEFVSFIYELQRGQKIDKKKLQKKQAVKQNKMLMEATADKVMVMANLARTAKLHEKSMDAVQMKMKMACKAKGGGYSMNFAEFCIALDGSQANTALKGIFDIFDMRKTGTIDYREYLICMANLISVSRPMKAKFCFEMFDEDKSGTIDKGELLNLLQATHLAEDPSFVEKKAEAVFRSGDADGSGELDFDEFVKVVNRFPNIVFPQFNVFIDG